MTDPPLDDGAWSAALGREADRLLGSARARPDPLAPVRAAGVRRRRRRRAGAVAAGLVAVTAVATLVARVPDPAGDLGTVGTVAPTTVLPPGVVWDAGDGSLPVVELEAPPAVRRIDAGIIGGFDRLVADRGGGLWIVSDEGAIWHRDADGTTIGPVSIEEVRARRMSMASFVVRRDGALWIVLSAVRPALDPQAEPGRLPQSTFAEVTTDLQLTVFPPTLPVGQQPFQFSEPASALEPPGDDAGRLWFWADDAKAWGPGAGTGTTRGFVDEVGQVVITDSYAGSSRPSIGSGVLGDPTVARDPLQSAAPASVPDEPGSVPWPGYSFHRRLPPGDDGTEWFLSSPLSDIGGVRGAYAAVRRSDGPTQEHDITGLYDRAPQCCPFLVPLALGVDRSSGALWLTLQDHDRRGLTTIARLTVDGRLSAVHVTGRGPGSEATVDAAGALWWQNDAGELVRLTVGDPDPDVGVPLTPMVVGPSGCIGEDLSRRPGTTEAPAVWTPLPPDQMSTAPLCGPKGHPPRPKA